VTMRTVIVHGPLALAVERALRELGLSPVAELDGMVVWRTSATRPSTATGGHVEEEPK
jgi:hypothetical protein